MTAPTVVMALQAPDVHILAEEVEGLEEVLTEVL
jgi:hypothetical protein